jgi:Protein of unknown function (DUF4232)
MRARLPSNWLSGSALPGSALSGSVLAAAAVAAVLAGCGSIQAPGTAAAGSASSSGGPGSLGSGGSGAPGVPDGTGSPGSTARASASASASASPGAGGSASATTSCAAAGLRVRLDTAAAGVAAGTYYVPLEFTNTTGRPCELAGYPAVAFTSGATGQQIGTEAAVDRAVRVSNVRLAPGATAHAWLQVLDAANYPVSTCRPVMAAGIRVVVPGSESASYLPHRVSACKGALGGSQILTVHPVQQGRARRGTA